MSSLLIKKGKLVTSAGSSISDILVIDGRIVSIDHDIAESKAERVIDAGSKYVFPGGIDPHVHLHLPAASGFSSDDFLTGSRAALYGGTTALIDFVTPRRGQTLAEALSLRKAEAKSSLTDYSFHVSPVEWTNNTEQEIINCIDEGITSFKVYMAYKDSVGLDDPDILKVMAAVAKAGGMVTIHCENGDEIENLRNIAYYTGHTGPVNHYLTRPASLESGAVARALEMAEITGCPLYIVHVSSRESLKHIREAKARGVRLFAETCPQYLLLDDSKYQGDFTSTVPFIISPPLRMKEDCEALWEALADRTIDTVATDHCPFTLAQKETGRDDFRKIPNGAGGVEHRMELLYTFGVLEGRISLSRMAELTATSPARIFGLFPRKGDIKAGADADLIIWNPDSEKTISANDHHQNCDNNIYEGLTVRGKAEFVITNGRIIIEKGQMVSGDTHGRFLEREPLFPEEKKL